MTLQTPFRSLGLAIVLIATLAGTSWTCEAKPLKIRVSGSAAPAQGPLYAARLEAMQFADDLASRRNLDPEWVRQAIGQSRYSATVARLMQPPTQAFVKNWRVYRSRFIDPVRISAGVRFWQTNREALERAEKNTACRQKSSSASSASKPFMAATPAAFA